MSSITDPLGWTPAIWETVNQAVHDELESSAVARKIVRLNPVGDPTKIPAGAKSTVNNVLTIPEVYLSGIETSVGFSMTKIQVQQELQMHTAVILAGLAGNLIGLTESKIFFEGLGVKSFSEVQITDNGYNWKGVVTLAANSINVPQDATGDYGINTYKAIVDGIAQLESNNHYGPYVLALHPALKADACSPLANTLISPCDRIESLVESFHGTNTLPGNYGFLLSRDGPGRTVTLVVGDTRCEFTSVDPTTGKYNFRVFVQWAPMVFDDTSFVTLKFL